MTRQCLPAILVVSIFLRARHTPLSYCLSALVHRVSNTVRHVRHKAQIGELDTVRHKRMSLQDTCPTCLAIGEPGFGPRARTQYAMFQETGCSLYVTMPLDLGRPWTLANASIHVDWQRRTTVPQPCQQVDCGLTRMAKCDRPADRAVRGG